MTVTSQRAAVVADAGPRSWLWLIALGLVLAAVLLGHSALRLFQTLPDSARTAARSAVRRHPRLVGTLAFVAGWTVIYGFYCLSFPHWSLSSSTIAFAVSGIPERGAS
jgi:hypothetical protein